MFREPCLPCGLTSLLWSLCSTCTEHLLCATVPHSFLQRPVAGATPAGPCWLLLSSSISIIITCFFRSFLPLFRPCFQACPFASNVYTEKHHPKSNCEPLGPDPGWTCLIQRSIEHSLGRGGWSGLTGSSHFPHGLKRKACAWQWGAGDAPAGTLPQPPLMDKVVPWGYGELQTNWGSSQWKETGSFLWNPMVAGQPWCSHKGCKQLLNSPLLDQSTQLQPPGALHKHVLTLTDIPAPNTVPQSE